MQFAMCFYVYGLFYVSEPSYLPQGSWRSEHCCSCNNDKVTLQQCNTLYVGIVGTYYAKSQRLKNTFFGLKFFG